MGANQNLLREFGLCPEINPNSLYGTKSDRRLIN
jgi:hypothetical protein